MKSLKFVLFAAALVALAGCTAVSSNDPTYTVQGTVSSSTFGIVSPATLTISQGSSVFSVSVPVPNSGVLGVPQSGTYSVSGIPSGTYTVVISFTDNSGYWFDAAPHYAVNGGSPVAADSWPDPAGTITFDNVTIGNSETVDVAIGSGHAS